MLSVFEEHFTCEWILEMYWQHNCSCNVVVWVIVSNFVVLWFAFLKSVPILVMGPAN